MKEIIARLEDEFEFINVVIERYAPYLSNSSMAFFGLKKELIVETSSGLKQKLAEIEAEAKKEMHRKAKIKAEFTASRVGKHKSGGKFTNEHQPPKKKSEPSGETQQFSEEKEYMQTDGAAGPQ